MGDLIEAQLRRMDTSQPWGFRMKGGAQQGMPLFIEQVSPNSRGAHAGLQAGDMIVSICKTPVQGMTHDMAKGELMRGGNELDIVVQRGGLTGNAPAPAPAQRAQVDEEPTCRLGGPTYKDVSSKTMQHLESELPAASQAGAPRPASIFDRKRQERSAYLKAQGPTIQKAYGEKQ